MAGETDNTIASAEPTSKNTMDENGKDTNSTLPPETSAQGIENRENNAALQQQRAGDAKDDDSKASADHSREKERIAQRQSRREKWQKNVKSDLTSQPESNDPDEIRKQVEFYFSDSNLPYDKFLCSKVEFSKNNPVPIKTIHDFKRMRRFQPYSAVVAALRESKFLEVTEDESIRRREPLAETEGKSVEESLKIYEDKAQPRSVYAKGFGEEGPSTQFDIEAFFAPYGPTNAIRLRRTFPDKIFKGSVFVEFESEEMQQAFLALDPKPKFKGKDLMIMSKKEYCDMKVSGIKSGKVRANESRRGRGGGRGRGGARKMRDRDRNRGQNEDGDDKDWKESRDKFQKNGFRDPRGSERGRKGSDSVTGKDRGNQDKDMSASRKTSDSNAQVEENDKDKSNDISASAETAQDAKASKDDTEARANEQHQSVEPDMTEAKKRPRESSGGDTARDEAAKKVKTAEGGQS